MKLVTAREMAAIDRRAIDELGVPGVVLMENAGRIAANELLARFPGGRLRSAAILAGSGNNGGDGFVIARHLMERGVKVAVICLKERSGLQGDALTNLEILENLGQHVTHTTDKEVLKGFGEWIFWAQVVVDALLGTGLDREVGGIYRHAVELINSLGKPVLSVDIPSGLSSDTGRPLGACVRAWLTVTFGLPKVGQVLFPGADYVGDLKVADIGIPKRAVLDQGVLRDIITHHDFLDTLAPRKADSHKGTYGHAAVVAGGLGFSGAAALCGLGAARMGAGLVTVGVPEGLNPVLEAKLTEPMTFPLADNGSGEFAVEAASQAVAFIEGKDAVSIGPGIGRGEGAHALVRAVLAEARCPVVVDADGLNVLARDLAPLKDARAPVIVTPHPGEMARLLDVSTKEVQKDRLAAAQRLAEETSTVVVLKGARTVVAEPGGGVSVCVSGNPGMASGGMGDVLTGMAAGALAQGMDPFVAARLSVFVHAEAADRAAAKIGERGLLATEAAREVPGILRDIEQGLFERDPSFIPGRPQPSR